MISQGEREREGERKRTGIRASDGSIRNEVSELEERSRSRSLPVNGGYVSERRATANGRNRSKIGQCLVSFFFTRMLYKSDAIELGGATNHSVHPDLALPVLSQNASNRINAYHNPTLALPPSVLHLLVSHPTLQR
jgi:hypothetical protein